jgi:hypothetical protein
MNQSIKFYSGREIAALIPCSYARVLNAIHCNELNAQRLGAAFAIAEHDALEYIQQEQKRSDPERLAVLEAENQALRAKLLECGVTV